MGLPTIPCVDKNQALTDLLESIALEETALAAFVNAEAEKIQAVAAQMNSSCDCCGNSNSMSNKEIIDFQKSVASIMQTAIKMQMLLQFKLEKVLDTKLEIEDDCGCQCDCGC